MTTRSRSRRALDRATRQRRHRSPANRVRHDDLPWSARVADAVTGVFGSWGFIVTQTICIVVWLTYNGYAALHYLHGGEFDPYPFILLNLLFSTQAAYAAPLILLSQNRTAERDRVKAEHDFDVNVLALRSLAELLAEVHEPARRQNLLRQVNQLLESDTQGQAPTPESDLPRGTSPSQG